MTSAYNAVVITCNGSDHVPYSAGQSPPGSRRCRTCPYGHIRQRGGIRRFVGCDRSPASSTSTVQVVEYYNASLDHYFMTASVGEIAALNGGSIAGWARTGSSFTANAPGSTAGGSPVCRYYGLPQAGLDSHFYSASPEECDAVATNFPSSWVKESNNVFQVNLPDLTTGACLTGSNPVYRLWNHRVDSNHRYTADSSIRQLMLDRGYISEGYGPTGVVFCVAAADGSTSHPPPGPASSPSASILVTAVAPDSFDFSSTAVPSSGATISSYAWDFGDGSNASGATASHRFTVSGTFPVVLTVNDSKGKSATATKAVTATVQPTVAPPPPPPLRNPTSADRIGWNQLALRQHEFACSVGYRRWRLDGQEWRI